MRMDQFDQLPDSARLYVFGASRPVSPAERDALLGAVDEFLAIWQAHKVDVAAARDWRHERFLLVGANEEVTALSGCSIDSLTRRIKELESALGLSLFDGGAIYYRGPHDIQRVSRGEFARLVLEGDVGPGTTVFNNTVTSVREVRAGAWELPFERSWHAQAFPSDYPAKAGK